MIATAALLLTLLGATPVATAGPEQTATAFYRAYGAGDLDALTALAEPRTAESLRKQLGRHLLTRCIHLLGSGVQDVRLDGELATVRIEALLAVQPRGGLETVERHDATLTMTQSPAGWRIASWRLRDEDVAEALIAATSEDERARIVSRNADALTPRLDALLGKRALALLNEGRLSESAALTSLITGIATGIGDERGLSDALGIDSARLRRPPKIDRKECMRRARQALALAESTRDPDVIGRALLRLSRAQVSETPWAQTSDAVERVLAIRDDIEDQSIVSLAAGQLSNYWADNGFPRRSLAYAGIARSIASSSGSKLALMNAEITIGMIYRGSGDYELAVLHLERGLHLAEETGFRDGQWQLRAEMAGAYRELGDTKRFLHYADLTLQPDAPADSTMTIEMALAMHFRDRHEPALAGLHAERAIAAAAHGADSRGIVPALMVLAEVRLTQARYSEALAAVARAEKEAGDPDRIDGGLIVARAYRGLHRTREAEEMYRAAIRKTEESSELLAGDDQQLRKYFAQRVANYAELADLLVAKGDVRGAFTASDESKGRTLLDSLQHQPRVVGDRMTDAEHGRERELVARVSALRDARDAPGRAALQESRSELDSFRAELRTSYDPLAPRTRAAVVTPEQLDDLLPDRRIAFLEYLITSSRLHVFVIRRGADGKVVVRVRTIPIERAALDSSVTRYATMLASRDFGYRSRARSLFDLLLKPVMRDLAGIDTVAIVADGTLWRLPFESLVSPDGRFVAQRFATLYAPSLAVYAQMTAKKKRPGERQPDRFLAFANPPVPRRTTAVSAGLRDGELEPLPDAEREVARIAKLYGAARSRLFVGADARESRLKQESGAYSVLHFATHGLFDDANPMYSHLLLAPSERGDDGLLEAWEMMRLDLHADLAVLSACETARGRYDAGEGMIGMSWALFAAGCPSTIATEWKVDSAAASDLMVAFYRRWLANPSVPFAKAAALRDARLKMLRDPARRHPFYWAPYVLIGSGS
jgi:CHAT domain-containing protein/tetratricopeptide (TPR) repeat protein